MPADRRERARDAARRDAGRRAATGSSGRCGCARRARARAPGRSSQWPKWRRSIAIRRERVLREPFLDGEVVEKDRQVGDEVRAGLGLFGIDAARVYACAERAATTSAMYELRTNGPENTARNPISSPMRAVLVEHRRVDVLDDVELLALRLQVLADRQDLARRSRGAAASRRSLRRAARRGRASVPTL